MGASLRPACAVSRAGALRISARALRRRGCVHRRDGRQAPRRFARGSCRSIVRSSSSPADHGESLGEHGERTHGVFVYDVTMRVPWFIWTGKAVVARSFDGLARLIDLAPTALDILGIPAPASFEGRSLLPAVNGRGPSRRPRRTSKRWTPISRATGRRSPPSSRAVPS